MQEQTPNWLKTLGETLLLGLKPNDEQIFGRIVFLVLGFHSRSLQSKTVFFCQRTSNDRTCGSIGLKLSQHSRSLPVTATKKVGLVVLPCADMLHCKEHGA